MAAIMNSSNLKFYAENTHVTPVTGGTSAGDTLYPKLDNSFEVNYNSSSYGMALPFTGRGPVIVNKSFVCGTSTKPFVGSLVGEEYTTRGEDFTASVIEWIGQGTTSLDHGGVLLPKYAGKVLLSFLSNSKAVTIDRDNGVTVGVINRVSIDSTHITDSQTWSSETVVDGDPGLLNLYDIIIEFTVPENTGTSNRPCARIKFEGENGLLLGYCTITQDSEAITLSTSSITLDNNTGVGSSVVTVSADDNWTIS